MELNIHKQRPIQFSVLSNTAFWFISLIVTKQHFGLFFSLSQNTDINTKDCQNMYPKSLFAKNITVQCQNSFNG